MVVRLLRLRAELALGAFRGAGAVRRVLIGAIAIVLTVLVSVALQNLPAETVDGDRAITVWAAAALLAGYLITPVISGAQDSLDPRRFRPFLFRPQSFAPSLFVAGLIGLSSLTAAAVCASASVVGVAAGAPIFVGILAGIGMWLTIALAGRVSMGLVAILLPQHRPRELSAVLLVLLLVLAFPIVLFFASTSWQGQVPLFAQTSANFLGYSPLGAPMGMLFSAAAGNLSGALVSAAVMLVTLGLLWWVWVGIVQHLLQSNEKPLALDRLPGLGWFSLFPAGEWGAVAARSLVYWFKDRRYLVNLLMVPVVGVLAVFPLLAAGVPVLFAVLLAAPVMAVFFGWLPHNDLAYDSTALWLHLASGVRGINDRVGRLIPVIMVAAVTLAVAVPVTLALVSAWSLLGGLTGLTASLFLSALGFSSITSVLSPYPVSVPGDSPFRHPQRYTARGLAGQALSLVGAVAVSIPSGVVLFAAAQEVAAGSSAHALSAQALLIGLGTGLFFLCAGVWLGGRIFDRSHQQLWAFVNAS